MKKKFIKLITAFAFVSASLFSCSSANENAAVEAEPLDDVAVVDTDVDRVSNAAVDYEDMFENVENTEQYGVLDLARMNPELSTFVEFVEMSGLAPSFEVAGPITVFVPTNEAFRSLSQERLNQLRDPQNRTELVKIIQRHILPSEVASAQFNTTQIIETQGENEIPVDTEMNGTVIRIGGAQIVKSDVEASNGMLHVVNGIIEPSAFSDVTPD